MAAIKVLQSKKNQSLIIKANNILCNKNNKDFM